MTSLTNKIREKLMTEFSALTVNVVDNSDNHCQGGAKLEVLVVSEAFESLPLLQRHRKVNACLDEFMDNIHALTIKAYTPSQYESKQ